MAKLSLGKVWKKLNKSDKKQFVKLYVERMKQSYSSKIDAYSDEKVEVIKIKQPKSNRIELITDLVSKNDKLEISYKYYKPKKQKNGKDRWLVYDVIIIGISILKTDKAQFKEFLQTKTIDDLMEKLIKK
jgi:phospholipid transport system substrate-binding protein